jgi:cysteine desulfurase
MEDALRFSGNPSSVHAAGRAARAVIERARDAVAALTHADSDEVIFTAGGTEALATALRGGVLGALEADARLTRIFVSALEHPAVAANAAAAADHSAGLRVSEIPATPDGIIDTEALRVALREGKGRTLVCIMAANNETGAVQPLAETTRLAKEAGALVLVDAVQAAGKIPCDFPGADYIALSAHKMGGPQGSGALIVRGDAHFVPLIAGGGQERGRRGGTQNVAGIAGFGAAAATVKDLADTSRIAALRDRFEAGLRLARPDAVIFAAGVPRLGNTSCFAIPGLAAETALIALDLEGVMVSSGSACSSGKVRSSHVLTAMGVEDALTRSALRVSLGWNSTDADVDAALGALHRLAARPRAAA